MTISNFQQANQLRADGQLEEAIVFYRQAIAQTPHFHWLYHNLGETLAQLERFDEAVNAYQRAIQLNPKSACSYYQLALALAQLGLGPEAIASYRQAVKILPEFYAFYQNLGKILQDKAQQTAVATFYWETLEMLVKQKLWDDAAQCYRWANHYGPNKADNYAEIVAIFNKKHELESQISTINQQIILHPNEANNYCQLGEIYAQNNKFLEAIIYYKKAIDLTSTLSHNPENFAGVTPILNRNLAYQRLVNLLIDYSEQHEKISNPNYLSPELESYYQLGNLLIQQGKFRDAIEICEQGISLKPNWSAMLLKLTEAYMKISWEFYHQGELHKSIEALEKAIDFYNRQLASHPLGELGIRFITPEYFSGWGWLGAIGHLVINIDVYIKMGFLGWRPDYFTILLAPPEQVINHSILNYWKNYLYIISEPELINRLFPLAHKLRCLEYTLHHIKLPDSKMADIGYATSLVHTQWEAEKRLPLLQLSPSDYDRGWQCLQDLGVPKDAWFICLHAREDGFRGEEKSHRSCDIDTYILAIDSIVARGGWVIRMGDPTMKPLPSMKQVIDYAHSQVKSDWMDVFLSVSCHFFIGSGSGLNCIPLVFGRPCVLTNLWPHSGRLPSTKILFIPKLGWYEPEQRYLTFGESIDESLFFNLNNKLLYDWGIKALDNTPEEIKEIVDEMFDLLEGKVNYTEDDEHLQDDFKSLITPYGNPHPANSRIGRNFIDKYRQLLY